MAVIVVDNTLWFTVWLAY